MAPSSSARWRWSVGRDDVDRDVAGGRIVLEQVEHLPAVELRQAQVQRDRVRPEAPGQRQADVAARGDHALEAALAREVEQHSGEA